MSLAVYVFLAGVTAWMFNEWEAENEPYCFWLAVILAILLAVVMFR